MHGYSAVANNHGLPGIVLRNPVTQAMGFALACFFAMMLAVGDRALDRRLRGLLLAASLLLLANLVFVTSGRSGHVLLLILFGGAAVQQLAGRSRVAAVLALPLLAALAVGVSPMLQQRFGLLVEELRAPMASERLSAMGIRVVMWDVSWQMARERPLLGYGTGGFPAAYERALARTSYSGWAATPTVDPHNQYLQVHLQAGIAGSAAFAWFLWAAFRQPAPRPYRQWATAMLLGWCVAGLATSVFTTFAESHMLMLLLGMLLATGADATPRPAAASPP
jgi:O-antigen ligase